jgi:hypothetical protein
MPGTDIGVTSVTMLLLDMHFKVVFIPKNDVTLMSKEGFLTLKQEEIALPLPLWISLSNDIVSFLFHYN